MIKIKKIKVSYSIQIQCMYDLCKIWSEGYHKGQAIKIVELDMPSDHLTCPAFYVKYLWLVIEWQ